MDALSESIHGAAKREIPNSAQAKLLNAFIFYQLETPQIAANLKLLPKAEFNCSVFNQKSRFSNYFQSFVVYLQKAVDGAVDKRIIRRLLRQNGLREVLNETE